MIIFIPLIIIGLALVAILTVGRMIVSHFPKRLGLEPVGAGDHWVRRDKERREEPVFDRTAASSVQLN